MQNSVSSVILCLIVLKNVTWIASIPIFLIVVRDFSFGVMGSFIINIMILFSVF